jgi:hypothetical protein
LSKHSSKKRPPQGPFGHQPVKSQTPPANPPEDDEDPTPVQGVRIPPGAVTPSVPTGPELSDLLDEVKEAVDNRDVDALAKDLSAAANLKEKVRDLVKALEETKALALQQEAEITALRVKVAGLHEESGMTDADVQALFAMCAEITFDRTRNGEAFVIGLKGRRSHTSGRVGRYGNFKALLAALRAKQV